MNANPVKELPVTLADIKRESPEYEFIQPIKNKIHDKNPNVPEVFSLCDDVLRSNDRVVIPNSLQRKILRDFHMGYSGKNRAKSFMHWYVYWPNRDRYRADMIESCKGGALAPNSPTTTCKPWPQTDYPGQRIHVNFAGLVDNIYYLIVVDSHLKWPEVLQFKRPPTNCTIGFLHELFALFGVVDCVVTDITTQSTSSEFRYFCKTYLVDHITTPQYHPRLNRQAESFVDTLKRALKRQYAHWRTEH